MAKEVINTNEVTLTKLEKAEAWIKENQKTIVKVLCAVAAAVVIGLVYYFFFYAPKKKEAAQRLAVAVDLINKNDYNTALNGDGGNVMGLEQIISEFGKKNDPVIYYYAAVAALNLGQNEENAENALNYLSNFKTKDAVLEARAEGLKGDAYAFKGDRENAIACYEKAAASLPGIMGVEYTYKAAQNCEILGNNEKALNLYKSIKEQFPCDEATLSNLDGFNTYASEISHTFYGQMQPDEIIYTIDKDITRLEVK